MLTCERYEALEIESWKRKEWLVCRDRRMLVVMMIFLISSEDTRLYLYSQRVVPEEYFYAKDLP